MKQDLRATTQVHDYTSRWTGTAPGGEHLPALSADVFDALAGMIETELDRRDEPGAVETERAAHRRFGDQRRRDFVGRAGELRSVVEHVTGDGSTPLAVIGPSGVGKTAFLAMVADEVARDLPERRLVVRYAGATGRAADPPTLLGDLLAELTASSPAALQSHELADRLRTALSRDRAEPVVVVLDALDQLESPGRPFDLGWLPDRLAPGVRVVVSAMEGSVVADTLRRRNLRVLAIEPMPAAEGDALLDTWLARAGRTLRPHQRAEVLGAFAEDGLPLHLRLATDEALRWTSFGPSGEIAGTVPALIEQLIERLAHPAEHGAVLVERALGYLAAARYGLGEDELLDVLSADPTVRADLRRRFPHSPDAARVPDVVWARLYSDLEPYLAERQADGATLLGFFHRQLGEAVERRYLGDDGGPDWHAALASYFRTGGSATPRRQLAELPRQLTLAGQWDELHDILTSLSFAEAKIAANGGVEPIAKDVRFAVDRVPVGHPRGADLRDLERLLGRTAHLLGGWDRDAHPGLVAQSLLTAAEEDGLDSWVVRTRERLRDHGLPWLERLRRTGGIRRRTLVRTVGGHPGHVLGLASRPGGQEIVTVASWGEMLEDGTNEEYDDPPRRWDVRTGALLQVLDPLRSDDGGHPLRPTMVGITPDGRYAVLKALWELLVWDLDARRVVVHRARISRGDEILHPLSTPDGQRYAVFVPRSGAVRIWQASDAGALARLVRASAEFADIAVDAAGRIGVSTSGRADPVRLRVWSLPTGRVVRELRGSTPPSFSVAVDPAGRWAVAGVAEDRAGIWDLATGELRGDLEVGGRTDEVLVTGDGHHAVLVDHARDRVAVLDLEAGRLSHVVEGVDVSGVVPGDAPDRVVAAHEGGFRVWDVSPAASHADSIADPEAHRGRITHAALVGDGLRAVTVSRDDFAIWDLRQSKRLRTFGAGTVIGDVALSPDGQHLVVARDGIELWDLHEGRLVRKIGGERVSRVALTPDGTRVVAAGGDGNVTTWQLATGERVRSVRGLSPSESPRALAVTPDGRQVLLAVEHTIRLIPMDGGPGQEIWGYPSISYNAYIGGPANRAMVLVPDGTLALVARGARVDVWDVRDRRQLRSVETGPGPAEPVDCVAISADGRLAVVGAGPGVAVFEVATGQRLVHTVMSENVTAAAIAVDGSAVLVGGAGGAVDCLRLAGPASPPDADVTPMRTFAIHYRTAPGEQMLLSGSAGTLGSWDLTRAVRLTWTEGHVWRATIALPEGAARYKYVLHRPGRPPLWEPGPDRETGPGDDPVRRDSWPG